MIASRSLFGFVAILATWNSISQAVTVPTVPVGNPGNAGDTVVMDDDFRTTGYGAVPYAFYIAKYDVTNSQYAEFLNSKDPAGTNKLGLWNANMADATYGGIRFNAAGANGSKYSLIASRQNHPVNYVNFYDAVRFSNWLNNGQGTGDTENGAYSLFSPMPDPGNSDFIARSAGAKVFLPSENEWYKAAYYNPATTSYFAYPTGSNSQPVASNPTNLANHANYNDVVGNLSDVGAYTGTTSPYGAFDMGGNVEQWNETLVPGTFHYRGVRGGYWSDANEATVDLLSSDRDRDFPQAVGNYLGFRVASLIAIIAPVPGWIGVADTSWNNPINWSGTVPGATAGATNTDTANFSQNAGNSPLTIDAGRNLKNITFDTASVNSLTVGTTGGNALLLTSGGTIQTTNTVVNPQTVNCPLVLEGDYTFTSGASSGLATLSVGGRITPGATSGVTTLTLSGVNKGANTIRGMLADNGSGRLAVAMSGPGMWILSSANTFSGGTTISGGTLVLGNSAGVQNSTVTINVDNGLAFAAALGSATLCGLAGNGKLALQDQAAIPAAVNVAVGSNGVATIYGGELSGAGGLTKVGAASLTLSGSNTFTGGTTINAGMLVLGNSAAVQNSTVTINSDNGLAFAASLGSATLGGLAGGGKLALQDQAPTPSAVNVTVGGNGASTVYGGTMSGSGGLTKTGAGTLTFSGNNTYSGGTAINAGILQLGDGATTNGSLAGNITDQATLAFANPIAETYTGVISGSGSVIKSAAGTLTLSAANTYSGGTTIGAGTLTVNSVGTLGSGPLTISAVTGTTSKLTLFANQTVSSLTSTVSGTGVATINVASSGTRLTSTGTWTATGTVTVTGGGTLEIDGAPTLAANSKINVNNDTVRLNITSGTATIGAGVTVMVGIGSTLELAGSISALSSGANRVNITTGSTSKGVLVSGTHQQVGQINGDGKVQVNAGGDLTAIHIFQGALVIGGTAGSHGLVTIDASDATGNPLGQSSGFALDGLLTPNDPFRAGGIGSTNLSSGDGADLARLSPANSAVGGNPSAVPEPSALVMMVIALSSVVGQRIARRRRDH